MLVYYITSSEHGLSNIEKSRIKIAKLDELNDPCSVAQSLQGSGRIVSSIVCGCSWLMALSPGSAGYRSQRPLWPALRA